MITVETGNVTTILKKLRRTEICFLIYESTTDIIKNVKSTRDVTKTKNGEWGMGNGEWRIRNGEWKIEK